MEMELQEVGLYLVLWEMISILHLDFAVTTYAVVSCKVDVRPSHPGFSLLELQAVIVDVW